MPRAFLICAAAARDRDASGESPYDPALLPLVDRPFLQHVVERLAAEGVDWLDVIVARDRKDGNDGERIETLLGDGTRWGFRRVAYHRASDRASAEAIAYALAAKAAAHPESASDVILLAQANTLPILPLQPYLTAGEPFLATDAATGDWTGWALARPDQIAGMPSSEVLAGQTEWITPFGAKGEQGDDWRRIPVVPVATVLSSLSLGDLLRAQKTLLDQAHPGLLRTGREIEPGVHLSRNVALHHTVTILPPVFIGQDCQIGAGCEIGPYAVIGDGCIVDEGATVAESLILPGSYIGEEIEVREAIVDRNRLLSVRFGESVELHEEFLLGDLSVAKPGAGLAGIGRYLRRLFGG